MLALLTVILLNLAIMTRISYKKPILYHAIRLATTRTQKTSFNTHKKNLRSG